MMATTNPDYSPCRLIWEDRLLSGSERRAHKWHTVRQAFLDLKTAVLAPAPKSVRVERILRRGDPGYDEAIVEVVYTFLNMPRFKICTPDDQEPAFQRQENKSEAIPDPSAAPRTQPAAPA